MYTQEYLRKVVGPDMVRNQGVKVEIMDKAVDNQASVTAEVWNGLLRKASIVSPIAISAFPRIDSNWVALLLGPTGFTTTVPLPLEGDEEEEEEEEDMGMERISNSGTEEEERTSENRKRKKEKRSQNMHNIRKY